MKKYNEKSQQIVLFITYDSFIYEADSFPGQT